MKNGEKDVTGFEDLSDDNIWDIIDPDEDDNLLSIETGEEKGKKKKELLDDEFDVPEGDDDEPDDADDDTDDDSDEPEPEQDSDEDENPARYFAKMFSEKGLLTVPEGLEVENDEDLDKIIEHTIEEGVNEYKSSLGSEALKFIEFVENGGNPADYINFSVEAASLTSMDESDPDNQKYLYKEYLRETTKFSDSKINKLIEQADIDDELEENAAEAKDFFKSKESEIKANALRQQEEDYSRNQKLRQEFVDKTTSMINNSQEVFDFPLGDKTKRKELHEYIMKPSVPYTTPDGKKTLITQMQSDKMKLQSDPEQKYKAFIFEALQLKNNFDLQPIKKKGVSEHNSKLKDLADRHKTNSSTGKLGKSGSKNSGNSGGRFTWETALKDF